MTKFIKKPLSVLLAALMIVSLFVAAPITASAATTVDLSTLDTDYVAQDGDTLTGTLAGQYKITVADGATVTLKDATITCLSGSTKYDGIALLGDATILLEGENTVKGGYKYNAGIFVPEEKTLTIDGTGSLNVSSGGSVSAIGAKRSDQVTGIPGGNIDINGGTINATGGNGGAGIGGCSFANCGTITINGGTVTAVGNDNAPGIGSGNRNSFCAGITITGGTVTATGNGGGAGIGCGKNGSCGNITIADTVTKVTAIMDDSSSNSIGQGSGGYGCGTITIGGEVTGDITQSPYVYPTYTVTWKNGDTVLETDTGVAAGSTPTYDGTNPEKASDKYYDYTFSGWSDDSNTYAADALPAVSGDVTYTAQFTATAKTFKVYVKKLTGGTYTIENLTGGTTVAQLKEIIADQIDIPATAQRLIFAGKEIEDAKTLAEYNIEKESTFHLIIRGYTVTWLNYNNSELGTTTVQYGSTPTYTGETPTKPEDESNTYTFAGWSPEVTAVTGEVTYTAQFTATPKHTEHTYEKNPTFNWSQDASTGDWNCNKLTLTCSGCDATQDYEVAGFFGTSAVTVTANADGGFTYTVSKKVDGVTYTDTKTNAANGVIKSTNQLKAAAKKGGSWELGADLTGVTDVQCANGFVLDGQNHTVTRHASVSTQAVFRTTTNPAEVTLKNLTIDGIAGQADLKPAVATKQSNPSAGNVFNLENVTITNYDFDQANNGAVLAFGHAEVNLTNCNVVTDSTYDVWGGAASTVNVDGGTVGGLYLNGGTSSANLTNNADVDSITTANGSKIATDSPATISVGEDYKLKDNGDGTYTVVPKEYVAQIEGGAKFETLAEAFAAAQDGDTITVLADCAGDGIKVTPAGKFANQGLTVDFNGHTYTVDGETVGSTGTETNGFQLLKNNNVAFKNGTITSTKAKILVQNYSNLELSNMTLTLDNPNYTQGYTLSDNNGVVTINDTTINANPAGGFAFDVCRFSSYPSVTVIVTGDSEINGDVEVSASKSDPKSGFTLSLQSGTLNGDIVIDPTAQAAMEKSDASGIAKTESFTQAAPEGYMWTDAGEGMQKLAAIPKDDVLTPVMAKKADGNQFGLGNLEYHFGTLLGVQKKDAVPGADKTSENEAQENGKDLRFVAVLQTDILRNAQDYGFVLAKVDSSRTTESVAENINALSADGVGNGEKVISARGSSNNVCGNDAYGDPSADTSYKYITCAVNGVEDGTKVVARFYVKIGGKTYYAQYPQGGSYTGNYTAAVAGINNGSIY